MQRSLLNNNQCLFNGSTFNGMPVQNEHGLLVADYLSKAHQCMKNAIDEYRSVFMFRFDLHLQEGHLGNIAKDNLLIERFVSSFKAKIKHSQDMKRNSGIRVHDTNVRYMWCRENSSPKRVHYHMVILVNHDAYAHIGEFSLGKNNMYTRLHGSWASALGIYILDVPGLIHIPVNPCYRIDSNDDDSFAKAFHRISYFCKISSKNFKLSCHSFGTSRN